LPATKAAAWFKFFLFLIASATKWQARANPIEETTTRLLLRFPTTWTLPASWRLLLRSPALPVLRLIASATKR
jgi:hypothetical protein